MKETRFFYVPGASASTELPQDEAAHALKVLRLKPGDELFLMDGEGTFYRAEVSIAAAKHCIYEIKEGQKQEKSWNGHIHIAVAPTKMIDRMEWFCEKATEVGVDEFSFLDCRFSERKTIRTDRLERIVVSAMKQSRKPWKPKVNDMQTFASFMAEQRPGLKYIAHCYDEIEKKDLFSDLYENHKGEDINDVTILIGPEGDFSIDEVKQAMAKGYESVTLGESRLRTETAALSSAVFAQLALRKKR